MKLRVSLTWIVVAALAGTVLMRDDEEASPPPAGAPDLFSFVQPLPGDNASVATHEVRHAAPAADSAPAAQATHVFTAEATVRQMRAHGASDDEVYRARAAALGAEKAASLARLDSEEAVWQQRVGVYLRERQAIAGDAALQALKERLFTAEEQVRLAAYEPAALLMDQ